MENTDRRVRARDSIRHLAGELDLPQELDILSERWNTVARLGDSGVIAKAATLADLVISDPLVAFKTEVDTCQALSNLGSPVHIPYGTGIHVIDGLPITLWNEVHGEVGEAPENQLVDSLAEIHRIAGDHLQDRPWFATITGHMADVMPKLRDRMVIDARSLDTLHDHYQRLLDQIQSANFVDRFIHGDAQRKNAMASESGAIWIDFEECSYGPVAWDLACLTMNLRFDTDRVLDRYAETSGLDRIENRHIDTLKQLRDIEAVTWMLAIQDEREPEFAQNAAGLLAEVLAAASDD